MKTAISIPDPVFKAAEHLAKRLDMSRSQLYTCAISTYVDEHKHEKITDLLNRVYADIEDCGLNSGFKKAQMKSIDKEEW